MGQIKMGHLLPTILRHCCLTGNQVKIEILNSVRGNYCLSLLSVKRKRQRAILRQTGNIVYCLFIILQKAVDYLGRASKAIKRIPYVKLHFRHDKLDVWGNVLIKYSRNNESLYSL